MANTVSGCYTHQNLHSACLTHFVYCTHMQVPCCFWNISVYLCLSFHKKKKRITQAGFFARPKTWWIKVYLLDINFQELGIIFHFNSSKYEIFTGKDKYAFPNFQEWKRWFRNHDYDNPSVQSPVCWCFCSCMVTEYLECWYILGCSNLGSNYAAYIYSVQLSFLWVFWKYRSKIMHTCRNSLTDSTCRDLIETITVIGTLQGLIWCRLTWMLDYQRL